MIDLERRICSETDEIGSSGAGASEKNHDSDQQYRDPASAAVKAGGARPRPAFTLMELQIVMSIMIILMLIAIPNFISMKSPGRTRTSAIQSLRAIYQAQIQYQTNFPANGFACSLARFGRQLLCRSAPSATQAAQVLQGDLATGNRSAAPSISSTALRSR